MKDRLTKERQVLLKNLETQKAKFLKKMNKSIKENLRNHENFLEETRKKFLVDLTHLDNNHASAVSEQLNIVIYMISITYLFTRQQRLILIKSN